MKYSDLINLFFPNSCRSCSSILSHKETIFCNKCIMQFPRFNENDTHIKDLFFGRIPLILASSMFYYTKKSIVQKVIFNLKYHSREEIGIFFGKWAGSVLKHKKLDIDFVIPVPIHKDKKKKRGYNQVDKFAIEIAREIDSKVLLDNLIRTSFTKTQTQKGIINRFKNVENIFSVTREKELENKHILIVDDVLTTGATLEACANKILKIKGTKISFFTIAVAQ